MRREELIGSRFGKLTIVSDGLKPNEAKQSFRLYECKCDCGNTIYTTYLSLKNGYITMCDDCAHINDRKNFKNVKDHPFYRKARSIKERCTKKDDHNYHNYGGRGIKCELGDTVPEIIKSLDKVPGYFEGAQIDRVDNNGNYTLHHPEYGDEIWYDDDGRPCLGNLRWTTHKENSLNKRTTVTMEDLRNFPRRKEKIDDVLLRNGYTYDDVILYKSYQLSVPGKPKYFVVLKNDPRPFNLLEIDKTGLIDPKTELLTKDDKYKYRNPNLLEDDPFYKIAQSIISKCNNKRDYRYRLHGALGIENHLGDSIKEVIESLRKVPGYKEGLYIDRTEPKANFSLIHPIHGSDEWIDSQGYRCLGTMRWAKYTDLQVRQMVNEELKMTPENLEKYPRTLDSLIRIIKENFNINDFVFIPIDNSNMSHRRPILYKAVLKVNANKYLLKHS